MNFKSILGTTCAFLAAVSFNANAIPTSADWKTAGDGLITYDANTELEWLDLTVTTGLSYGSVLDQLGAGGAYDGFRFASLTEVQNILQSFGIPIYHGGFGGIGSPIYEPIANMLTMMGDTFSVPDGRVETGTLGFFDKVATTTANWAGAYYQSVNQENIIVTDGIFDYTFQDYDAIEYAGSYLVRNNVNVPEPSVAILITSGLISLIVFARRKA